LLYFLIKYYTIYGRLFRSTICCYWLALFNIFACMQVNPFTTPTWHLNWFTKKLKIVYIFRHFSICWVHIFFWFFITSLIWFGVSYDIKWFQPSPGRSCGRLNCGPSYQVQCQSPLNQLTIGSTYFLCITTCNLLHL
jgi:hypothetical protein